MKALTLHAYLKQRICGFQTSLSWTFFKCSSSRAASSVSSCSLVTSFIGLFPLSSAMYPSLLFSRLFRLPFCLFMSLRRCSLALAHACPSHAPSGLFKSCDSPNIKARGSFDPSSFFLPTLLLSISSESYFRALLPYFPGLNTRTRQNLFVFLCSQGVKRSPIKARTTPPSFQLSPPASFPEVILPNSSPDTFYRSKGIMAYPPAVTRP